MQYKRFKMQHKKNILTMYLVCAINADTMAGRQETIEQFIARGGKIKKIPAGVENPAWKSWRSRAAAASPRHWPRWKDRARPSK